MVVHITWWYLTLTAVTWDSVAPTPSNFENVVMLNIIALKPKIPTATITVLEIHFFLLLVSPQQATRRCFVGSILVYTDYNLKTFVEVCVSRERVCGNAGDRVTGLSKHIRIKPIDL